MANKKYKLSDDYWETSGVYDLTEGKTQRQINAALKGAINDEILYFTGQTVSATTGNIVDISNAKITGDYVLLECEFQYPNFITSDLSWATSAGHFTMNGSCVVSGTVDITLGKKGN